MDPRAEPVVANLLGLYERFRGVRGFIDLSAPDVSAQASEVLHPMFNTVGGARFGEDARGRTREVASYFLKRRLPFLWWVDPAPGSREVAAVLLEIGLQSVPVVGMHRSLDGTTPHDLSPTSAADPRFVDLVMRVFQLPELVRGPLLESSHVLDPDAAHILVVEGETPVACGSGIASGGSWGIYNIATLPSHQGLGHGRRIVEALLHEGARRGLREAVLHASPMGLSVYRAAGFDPVVELTEYVWQP